MLMLSDAYSGKFDAFVKRLSDSGSAQVAFSEVYGKSLADILLAMNAYFRQSSIGAAAFRSTLRTADIGPAKPATELETSLTLAKLSSLLGRFDEAKTRLEALSTKHPENYEIDEARAYLAWRSDARPQAIQHFQSALQRGTPGWKTRWDFARLLEVSRGDRVLQTQVLRSALLNNPELDDARMMLVRNLYEAGELPAARTELQLIKNVSPEQASAFETLKKAVEQRANAATNFPLAPEADDVPNRPVLRRTAPPKPTKQ
jgi:tetratricopeptide (TPR) repeat protein